MDVKVGQVWVSTLTGMSYTVKEIKEETVVSENISVSTCDLYKSAFNGKIFYLKRDVIEFPKLSDLEIVQKALELTSSSMEVDYHGYYWIYSSEYGEAYMHGPDKESLLTWAKQTIGE